jgi:hypothetical protein
MNNDKHEIQTMLAIVEDCVKNNKLEFLASVLFKLQREYKEVCELSTDGDYQVTWTHQQVLDYLTYQHKC